MRKINVYLIIIMIGASLIGCSGHNQPVSKGENIISGTIYISTLSPNRFLEEAGKKFESRHPGVKVEIDAYLTPEMIKQNDPNELADNYISTLNTQLMSGKGADIIYANALPYKKYVARHMFADLNQLMKADPDYDAGKYYTNLFDAVEINHGLYTLPIGYVYNLLESKHEIGLDDKAWNWQDFFKAAQTEIKDQECYILPGSDEELFNIIFRQNYGHFVNEEKSIASFDSKTFIALLQQCKDLADKDQIAKTSAKASPAEGKPALFQYHDGVSSISALAATQGNLYRLPSDDRGNYCFVATMYAINNASPNKSTAWEFLKYLISDDMQTSPSLGLPMNKTAFKERCSMETQQLCSDQSVNIPRDKKIELMQKYAAFNESMVSDLRICPYVDPQIKKIVDTEVHAFFADKTSAEDAAHIIQKKVSLYLKE